MVDYSKWGKIEISDDEDDTHPNVDTGSLFRWRHDDRVKRLAERREKQKELVEKETELDKKLQAAMVEGKTSDDQVNLIENELAELKAEREKFERRERLLPWNVDTISHDGWSQTVLNKSCLLQGEVKPEHEREPCTVHDKPAEVPIHIANEEEILDELDQKKAYSDFLSKHEVSIREFGFRSRFDDCRRYLLAHPELASQHTYDYLCIWCMQLELENKKALLEHVAHQAVIIQMILDLAKTLANIDPRSCLPSFFSKALASMDKFEELKADELRDFRERVGKAAEMRITRAIMEQEDAPETLIGPGGLNAQEVFDSLPENLQNCFIERDHRLLVETLKEMDTEEAKRHMSRCIDSGLWMLKTQDDPDELLLQKVLEDQAKAKVSVHKSSEGDDDDEDDSDA